MTIIEKKRKLMDEENAQKHIRTLDKVEKKSYLCIWKRSFHLIAAILRTSNTLQIVSFDSTIVSFDSIIATFDSTIVGCDCF